MPHTIIADIDTDLLAALESGSGLLTLRAILLRYKASGVTAAQVAGLLQELRPATQEGPLEDVILDALDIVTGWCAPHLRVWDEVGDEVGQNRAS